MKSIVIGALFLVFFVSIVDAIIDYKQNQDLKFIFACRETCKHSILKIDTQTGICKCK